MNTNNAKSIKTGLLIVAILTAVATACGSIFPLVGSAVSGLVLGILARHRIKNLNRSEPGIQFAGKTLMPWSIVLLGLSLPIGKVTATGADSIVVTLSTISAAFISALCFGRLLRVPPKLAVLIGTGTAICGGSAIAAMTPAIRANQHETAYSLSTIFLFNLIAVIVFPFVGRIIGLSDHGFAVWAGTAINDTSSVIATAYAWSQETGDLATIVKLSRAMLIIPATLLIGGWFRLRSPQTLGGHKKAVLNAVPWFIVFFAVASFVNQYLPASAITFTHTVSTTLITAALVAVGLSTDLHQVRVAGWRPLALGLLVWSCVATTSLVTQHLLHQW